MRSAKLERRLLKLEESLRPRRRGLIPIMVSGKPVPLGTGPEEPIPAGHLRVYLMRFSDDDPRFVDVPEAEVKAWLVEHVDGLVIWI